MGTLENLRDDARGDDWTDIRETVREWAEDGCPPYESDADALKAADSMAECAERLLSANIRDTDAKMAMLESALQAYRCLREQ